MTAAFNCSRSRRRDPYPAFLTWNICYEFLRVITHPRVFRPPWVAQEAWRFVESLLTSPGFNLLLPTDRHATVIGHTLSELPGVRGNMVHDLHTAVLMREHGVSRICTPRYRFSSVPVPDGSGSAAVAGRRGSAPSAPRTGLKPVPTAMRAPGGWKCLRVICQNRYPSPGGGQAPALRSPHPHSTIGTFLGPVATYE